MQYKCDDCKDTGLIETESVILSDLTFDKLLKRWVHYIQGKGDWKMNQCHCIGED